MSSLLDAWHAAAMALLPPGIEVWDGHTHTGSADPDGYTNDPVRLLAALDAAGHAGAVVMTSADPHGYRAQNARVLAEATASGGRLLPFLRVDPTISGAAEDAAAELPRGFRGIKLHPRSEGFAMDHPGVAAVGRVAAARRIPVLVHAGRGMPPLGDALTALLDDTSGLTVILAHAGISDLAWIGPESGTRPGLLFDTSWWNAADLLSLFATVDASQIVYASDMPYWRPAVAATIVARAAVQAGLSGEGLRAVFGGNLHRALSGTPRSATVGTGFAGMVDPGLLRVASNLYAAIGAARGDASPAEAIDLAMRATEAVGTPHDSLLTAIRITLDAALADPDHHPGASLDLLVVACAAALTPLAGAPRF